MRVTISGALEYRFDDVDVEVPDGTPISSMHRWIEENIDFAELRTQGEPELDLYAVDEEDAPSPSES